MRARLLPWFLAALAAVEAAEQKAKFFVSGTTVVQAEKSGARAQLEPVESEPASETEGTPEEPEANWDASGPVGAEQDFRAASQVDARAASNQQSKKEVLRAAIASSLSSLKDMLGPVLDPQTIKEDVDDALAALMAVATHALDALGLSSGTQSLRGGIRPESSLPVQQKQQDSRAEVPQMQQPPEWRELGAVKEMSSQEDDIEPGFLANLSVEDWELM